ncbi:10802_t:CDS:2, partial [Paraglomus occultum]
EPTAVKLNKSMTLKEIREMLSQCDENSKSIMKSDMCFCNKGGPNVIRTSEEANIYLGEIIGDNNTLCIKRAKYLNKSELQANSEEFCGNGIEWKFNLNMAGKNFLMSTHFTQKGSNGVEHKSCRVVEQYSRETLFMKKEHIKPSDKFRDRVERSLKLSDQKERRDALIKVGVDYEFFGQEWYNLEG